MTYGVCWSRSLTLATLTLCACSDPKSAVPEALPLAVTDTLPKAPNTDEITGRIEQFFSAATWNSQCPDDTTCVYVQTFADGATRELTLRVSPNRKYTPTSEELSRIEPGKAPIFDFKYASDFQSDPARIELAYYVGKDGLPATRRSAQNDPMPDATSSIRFVRLASLSQGAPPENHRLARWLQEGNGGGMQWTEVGKKGSDVGIGALIDAAKDKGIKGAGPLGTVYSLASLLADGGSALELASQNSKWLAELDALEKCATNPTNKLSSTDPEYSKRASEKIQSARRELKEVNSVRFLNQFAEKSADFSTVTTVMSIGLKQGYAWSEQGLSDYSENTIMREARGTVVGCGDPPPDPRGDDKGDSKGNVRLASDCTTGNVRVLWELVGNVTWEWEVGIKWSPRGTFKFKSIKTAGSCTTTETGSGELARDGHLAIYNNPARERELGYGYEARLTGVPGTVITGVSNCRPGYTLVNHFSFPVMQGYADPRGVMSGSVPAPGCNMKLTWAFTASPRG